jgi:DNA-binding transcriptional MerR regulator
MQTLKSIAIAATLPETTVRLYRDEFEEFLPAAGEGRRRRYGPESAARLERICAWKRDGRSGAEIREALAREARPQERARRRTTEERLDELVALARGQSGDVVRLRAEVATLRAAIGDLAGEIRGATSAAASGGPTMEAVTAAFWSGEPAR